jgi:hypothetical protein
VVEGVDGSEVGGGRVLVVVLVVSEVVGATVEGGSTVVDVVVATAAVVVELGGGTIADEITSLGTLCGRPATATPRSRPRSPTSATRRALSTGART